MPFIVYTSKSVPVELETNPLAAPGGEGAVHRIKSANNFSDCCAKIYHLQKRTNSRRKKIEFMVNNKPQILLNLNYKICWPIEMVFDKEREFIGFIMPLAFTGSEKLYEITTTRISPRLISKWSKFDRLTKTGIEKRLKVCVNIAIAVHFIHQTSKYAIVDYKPQNILITTEGKISFTDVDSFQISENGVVLHRSEVATPEYAPPESFKLNPSKSFIPESWDRFSLAVSFYEILFGIHPYVSTCGGQYENVTTISEKINKGLFVHGSKKTYLTVVPPIHTNFQYLPLSIKELFVNAFENGHTNPIVRPSAENWGQTISKELATNVGIKANEIIIQEKKKTTPSSNSSKTYSYPVNTGNSSQIKKTVYPTATRDDYMVWKIFCGILLVIVVILFFRGVSNDDGMNSLKAKVSTLEGNNFLLKKSIDSLQNRSNALYIGNSKYIELAKTIDIIAQTYPIILNDIKFNNVNHESVVITSEMHEFTKSEMQYVQPVLRFNSTLRTSSTINVNYKITDPNGKLLSASDSPDGYSWHTNITIIGSMTKNNKATLDGFGLSDWPAGKYNVEIWYNSTMLGQSYFNITQ